MTVDIKICFTNFFIIYPAMFGNKSFLVAILFCASFTVKFSVFTFTTAKIYFKKFIGFN